MKFAGLYIHIPYCLHKCGYCDFNSHNLDREQMEGYVSALLREIELTAPVLQDHTVISLFFGGGTPTTLPAGDQIRILKACRKHFNFIEGAEITTEANPSTVETENLKCLRAAGINRISVGVQSFDPDELQRLDRVHSVDEVYQTVERARTAGFDNLSLDLMFALPGQTVETWKENLKKTLDLEPEHISAYNLTIEKGTAFYKQQEQGKLQMPSDDFQRSLFEIAIDTLTGAGYRSYEISNYAKPGKRCRHNLNYWHNGEYLGLGAGASSYVNGNRYKNIDLPARYIEQIQNTGAAVNSTETPDRDQQITETVMLGLRLREGLHLPKFEDRFGVSFLQAFEKKVDRLKSGGLLEVRGGRAFLSREGLFLADSVIMEFMA